MSTSSPEPTRRRRAPDLPSRSFPRARSLSFFTFTTLGLKCRDKWLFHGRLLIVRVPRSFWPFSFLWDIFFYIFAVGGSRGAHCASRKHASKRDGPMLRRGHRRSNHFSVQRRPYGTLSISFIMRIVKNASWVTNCNAIIGLRCFTWMFFLQNVCLLFCFLFVSTFKVLRIKILFSRV